MRHLRNIIIGIALLFITIGFCLYISSVLFILLVWGPYSLDFQSINPNFRDFPYRLWPTIFDYIYSWWANRNSYPAVVELKLFVSVLGPFSTLAMIFWSTRSVILNWKPFEKKESLHGDAKWATEKEIRKIGLRSKHGLLLGKDKKGFLIAGGFQHALLFAPTGSGKGVGFVIPNLLFWKDSVIVHDIKLENYELTSGYRKKIGQEVYCWSPADADGLSHCYNPLDWVSSKPGQMVDDVQKIANLLMPEQDFWVNEARSLFLGVVLYILAVPEKIKSFGEVVRTMRSDDVVYNLAVVLDTIGQDIHPVAYMNIAAFLQKAEKERSGVISTMNSSLELWANPLIDTTTASSDFNFMDFKKKRVTVYVGLTPDNLTRLQPLMQVFYQQATEFLCRKLPDKKTEPYGVLFMMDEFPTLGEMEQFKTGIAYFRGYNVRLFLIIQDTEQLKGIYEEAGMNSFLSNSTYRITFAANNIETANLISQLIGNKTVEQESLNKPKFLDLNPASRSLHVSETQRALLLPQEVIMLPRDEQILLIESTSPIKSKKIFYYKDSFFTKRLHDKTFVPIQEPFSPKSYEKKIKEEKRVAEENQSIENLESLPQAEVEEETIPSEEKDIESDYDDNLDDENFDDDDEFDDDFEEDDDNDVKYDQSLDEDKESDHTENIDLDKEEESNNEPDSEEDDDFEEDDDNDVKYDQSLDEDKESDHTENIDLDKEEESNNEPDSEEDDDFEEDDDNDVKYDQSLDEDKESDHTENIDLDKEEESNNEPDSEEDDDFEEDDDNDVKYDQSLDEDKESDHTENIDLDKEEESNNEPDSEEDDDFEEDDDNDVKYDQSLDEDKESDHTENIDLDKEEESNNEPDSEEDDDSDVKYDQSLDEGKESDHTENIDLDKGDESDNELDSEDGKERRE